MRASRPTASYRFGSFELQPREFRLLAAGKPVHVTSRAFDLLLALVESAGRLTATEDLAARVWPGRVVEPGNIHAHVSALRRILGTQAIENVAGHGYRLTLDVAAGEPTGPAPLGRHNLPRQLTRFIGREAEVADCGRLLGASRLLTLTGIGGIGKTRLSLEVAQLAIDRFPDGIWLVEFAPLREATLVPQAIAAALGVAQQTGRTLLDAIVSHVAARRLLIVLDNCEHLLAACAHVAKRLLEAAGGLTVMASSREPLHLVGETAYPLPALSTPDAGTVDALAASDAVRLFVDRANAVQPEFELTPANAASVGAICTRLDGIPLAIELAAAHVRSLSVDAIAQRLADRFRLLRIGDRTAAPRHQTLRAAIDWSYELLTPPERSVLQRLAVFVGGWTLDAAVAVAADPGLAAADFVALHGELVEKSLVVAEHARDRYSLLETVRLYAAERLGADGNAATTRTRHFEYCLSLAEAAAARTGTAQEDWWRELTADRENLREAHAWSTRDDARARAELQLVIALAGWLCANEFDLGSPILARALGQPATQPRDALRCHALNVAGYLSYYRGQYDVAPVYLEEGLAIARELDDAKAIAEALCILGAAAHGCGDLAAARRHLVAAQEPARRSRSPVNLWGALTYLAELHATEGDLDAAEPLYVEALACARSMGAQNMTVCTLLNLARIALSRRAADAAGLQLRQAFPVFEEMGAALNLHAFLAFCAGLAALRGEFEVAARFKGASDRALDRMGQHREPADANALAPLMSEACLGVGEEAFAAARSSGWSLDEAQALRELRAWMRQIE
ncbi:MAG: winged helix-turn-helix domain-containing protein [Betaproteobacteria bacterium]|nr:winged helix-turn-helix domain-containing protein [Betaproteobacteria bacterium]